MNVSRQYYPVLVGRIFFFLALPHVCLGQARSSVDARAAQSRIESTKENVLVASIIVKNTSARKQNYSARVVLPEGWKLILRETPFELQPGQQDTRLISVSLPPETPSGAYQLRYFISDRSAPSEEAEVLIEVVVLPIQRIDLQLLETPRFVVAGKDYAVQFSIINAGNVTSRVRLRTRNSENYTVKLDSNQITLRPRETRVVTALVSTIRNIPGKVIHSLELTAQLVQDAGTAVKASSVVDIIPQVASSADRYLSFPLKVTGRMSGEDDRLGGQLEIVGAGSFTEDRRDRLEVMIRTPDVQSQSSIGLRDEYRIRYVSPYGEIKIGDWSYSLSPLTELSRYGFGGEGRVEVGGVQAGGFFNESRFFTPRQRQIAGFARYEFITNYALGVNYLKKEERNESEIRTVRAQLRPDELANLDLEYGASSAPAGSDNAYALQLRGNQRQWMNYDVRHVNAGSGYTGFYRDLDYTSLNINVAPAPSYRIEAYFRMEERNKRKDTTLFYAPREQFVQIGGGYTNLLSAYYRLSLQDDRMPVPQYDRREDVLQLRIGIPLKEVNLFTNIDFGVSKDQLGKRESPFQRYAVFGGFSPTPSQQYNTSVEYSVNRSLFSGEKQERVSASLGMTLWMTSFSSLQTTIYWSRTFATFKQDFALFDFTLQHVFPWEHKIAVRGRQNYATPATNGRELAYSLQYSVPVAIPLKRLSSSGQLQGKIVDERGRSLANVLVNVGGSAAITDRNGEFNFPALSPDRYFLVVDKVSIGMEKVTVQRMPLEVQIRGGEETKLSIQVTRRVTVSGEATLFAFDEADASGRGVLPSGQKSGVFVELTDGSEIYRRVTDSRGRFVFTDLRPGNWKLTVTGGDIPQFHYAEKEAFEMALKPGGKEELAIRILPRKRTIRIIEEGAVIQAVPPRSVDTRRPPENCLTEFDSRQRGYMIQVSSWVTRAKAAERVGAIERLTGMKASIERADVPGVGRRFRVKVGPFRTSQEAESACRLLEVIRDQ